MYTNKKLFTIIKINAAVVSLYFALRIALFLNISLHIDIFITAIIAVVCGVVAFYLSSDIWASKGMLFMSFMLMLFVTDLIFFAIIIINNLVLSRLFVTVWLSGTIGFISTIMLLIYGFVNEKMVKKNVLKINSTKIETPCKYAMISDIHFGTIQPSEILADTIKRINEEEYDGVFLVGDIAEENTSHDSLLELFHQLGKLKSKKGTYFVHGNHDKQEKLHVKERSYTDDEFNSLMENANIKCIDDSVIDLSENIQLIARNDYSVKNRMDISKLLKASDKNKLRILIEHQTTEYSNIVDDGVEVILSAHYHGAQNWPNNILYHLAGMQYNGKYTIKDSILYVNAGLTGSKYNVRTHGHCEYLCLEISPSNSETTKHVYDEKYASNDLERTEAK